VDKIKTMEHRTKNAITNKHNDKTVLTIPQVAFSTDLSLGFILPMRCCGQLQGADNDQGLILTHA
jgi:hypothetical protein